MCPSLKQIFHTLFRSLTKTSNKLFAHPYIQHNFSLTNPNISQVTSPACTYSSHVSLLLHTNFAHSFSHAHFAQLHYNSTAQLQKPATYSPLHLQPKPEARMHTHTRTHSNVKYSSKAPPLPPTNSRQAVVTLLVLSPSRRWEHLTHTVRLSDL